MQRTGLVAIVSIGLAGCGSSPPPGQPPAPRLAGSRPTDAECRGALGHIWLIEHLDAPPQEMYVDALLPSCTGQATYAWIQCALAASDESALAPCACADHPAMCRR